MVSTQFHVILAALFVSLAASSGLPKEINLFAEVGLPSVIPTGVRRTTGYHNNSPAFHFSSSTSHLSASNKGFNDARRVIETSHDFIVSAYVKIDQNAKLGKNTILSISSNNGQQLYFFFAISSDWQTSQLLIEFSFIAQGNLRTIRVKSQRSVDFTKWHKVAMRIQDTEKLIRFYLDDNMVDVRKFSYTFTTIPSNCQLRLAQVFEVFMEGTGEIRNRFLGSLQDVKIALGSSQTKCNTPTKAPTPCKCPSVGGNECTMDDNVYAEGQQWNRDKCNVCQCKRGNVFCIHTCPVCKDDGKIRLHGDNWHPSNDSCINCRCESGKTICTPPACSKPDCSKPGYSGQMVTLPGQCCPICKEDQCRPTGRVYRTCGCSKTCDNHHLKRPCGGQCTEGCFCPQGEVLSDKGTCISPTVCKCSHNGRIFKPGQFYSASSCKFCICLLGYMHCNNMCS